MDIRAFLLSKEAESFQQESNQTTKLPLSREEAMIMEEAHLNLHQNENLYGHDCKTFPGSHTTLKQSECSATSADVTGTEEVLYSWVLFWLSSVKTTKTYKLCILCCIIHYSLIATAVLNFLVFV